MAIRKVKGKVKVGRIKYYGKDSPRYYFETSSPDKPEIKFTRNLRGLIRELKKREITSYQLKNGEDNCFCGEVLLETRSLERVILDKVEEELSRQRIRIVRLPGDVKSGLDQPYSIKIDDFEKNVPLSEVPSVLFHISREIPIEYRDIIFLKKTKNGYRNLFGPEKEYIMTFSGLGILHDLEREYAKV